MAPTDKSIKNKIAHKDPGILSNITSLFKDKSENVYSITKKVLFDPNYFFILAIIMLVFEVFLNIFIINKVKCKICIVFKLLSYIT